MSKHLFCVSNTGGWWVCCEAICLFLFEAKVMEQLCNNGSYWRPKNMQAVKLSSRIKWKCCCYIKRIKHLVAFWQEYFPCHLAVRERAIYLNMRFPLRCVIEPSDEIVFNIFRYIGERWEMREVFLLIFTPNKVRHLEWVKDYFFAPRRIICQRDILNSLTEI